jgi:VanZ family protein
MSSELTLKRKILNYIFIAAALSWTAFIFSNSLNTAAESLEQSGIFVAFFVNIANAIYGDSIPIGLSEYIELHLVDHIRNIAHVFEFFVLYLLARLSFKSFSKIKRVAAYAFLYGLIIMVFDETIQIFVDGRGFQIKDLLLDTLGMILGLTVIFLIRYFRIRKQGEQSKKHENVT